ncbi:MAG TPA: tRNA pseudouridine(38-40) synthase TruA [Syntrophomonadaceae bacterium]|nr:tRNA pseudouridine(38-40) synthase TruA [Syntrophomonadaceae bacterium]
METRIRLTLEYDGSSYHGFQMQKNALTVQEVLEEAIFKLTGERISLVCAGRTDAGVHALGQVVAFNSSSTIPAARWKLALNTLIPEDIRVVESQATHSRFNPRYDARSKRYVYLIYRSALGSIFYRHYALCTSEALDLTAMQEGAGLLVGCHNFRAFCASGSSAKTFVRRVIKCRLEEKGPFMRLDIEGQGFLYNMVRIIMGTLLEVGRGKHPSSWIKEVLESQDRKAAGPTVPAQGLYLVKVFYPDIQSEPEKS